MNIEVVHDEMASLILECPPVVLAGQTSISFEISRIFSSESTELLDPEQSVRNRSPFVVNKNSLWDFRNRNKPTIGPFLEEAEDLTAFVQLFDLCWINLSHFRMIFIKMKDESTFTVY